MHPLFGLVVPFFVRIVAHPVFHVGSIWTIHLK